MKYKKLELHENATIEIHPHGDEHGETVLADITCGEDSNEDDTFALMIELIQLYNAANGMPTAEAVKYIEHGREALEVLKNHCSNCEMGFEMSDQVVPCNEPGGTCANKNIVAKLEAK